MGQITLNREDAMRVLNNQEAAPSARVIAACSIAFFETRDHVDEADSATRSIAMKLSHMVMAEIFDAPEAPAPDPVED